MLSFCLCASPALAQSTYVVGALGADISRFNRYEGQGVSSATYDGEPLSLTLRVGTAVAERWGVELGWVDARRTHTRRTENIPIPLAFTNLSDIFTGLTTISSPQVASLAPFSQRVDVDRRNRRIEAVAWATKRVAGRADLAFVGGVAFNRSAIDTSTQFILSPLAGGFPIVRPVPIPVLVSTHVVDYSVAPVVGMDARIEIARHVRVIPGVRFQGKSGGWLLQPNAGLAWFF